MPCVAVAYSGGRDSTALLHAAACAAREANREMLANTSAHAGVAPLDGGALCVVALHVHHGLSPHADAWLAHAQAACDAWAAEGLPVRLVARHVRLSADAGQGVEAEARALRHQALHEMAAEAGADMLLLAHHRRDQAETLLLQALRGGGLAGLAAMPKDDLRDGLRWVRPWLDHPREAIEAYVAAHGLSHIDDESNSDPRFARNRLRLAVWPALQAAFPQAEVALAASAARLADALAPLRSWQSQALAVLQAPDDVAAMNVGLWARWTPAERRESLRHWFASVSGQALSAQWTLRLADELPRMLAHAPKPEDACGVWPALGLGLYRGRLRWAPPAAQPAHSEGEGVAAEAQSVCIDAPGDWPLPAWGGMLRVLPCTQGGVAPEHLLDMAVAARTGGERFQAGPGRPPRTLKKQFQMLGVPAWERGAPLFWAGGHLLFVPGLGLDARCWAPPGMPQWAMSWHRLDAEPAAALKCEV